MTAFLLPLSLALIPYAGADSLDLAYIRRLSQAHDVKNLTMTRDSYRKLKTARLACAIQLRESQAPIACFDALAGELAWGLTDPRQAQAARARLDRLCVRAADQLRFDGVPPEPNGVPQACRAALTAAADVRAYRREAEPGANLDYPVPHVEPGTTLENFGTAR